MKFAQLMACKY